MTKQTTTDQLKALFAQYSGNAEDWKRLSKKKNADGHWVRVFENKKDSTQLEVTDIDGKFDVRRLAKAYQKAAANSVSVAVETDPARNAAADKFIDLIIEEKHPGKTILKELAASAGQALANRYCFAIYDGKIAMITPIKFFEKRGYCTEMPGPIGHLLPECFEAMESAWEVCNRSVKTSLDAGKYLQKLGFVWNREFQNYIESGYTETMEVLEKTAAKSKKSAAPGRAI